jgi:hypothetical protein
MGFRKNSKFPNRLAIKAQHIKLDVITFFNNHTIQYGIFKKFSSMLEYFILKYFPFFQEEQIKLTHKYYQKTDL